MRYNVVSLSLYRPCMFPLSFFYSNFCILFPHLFPGKRPLLTGGTNLTPPSWGIFSSGFGTTRGRPGPSAEERGELNSCAICSSIVEITAMKRFVKACIYLCRPQNIFLLIRQFFLFGYSRFSLFFFSTLEEERRGWRFLPHFYKRQMFEYF